MEPFSLPNLRTLIVVNLKLPSNVFQKLRTPNLESLELQGVGFDHAKELMQPFKDLVNQPEGLSRLTDLVLRGVSCPEQTLIWFLEHTPTIGALTIRSWTKCGDELIEALKRPATTRRTWLAPNLKSLVFTDCYMMESVIFNDLVRVRVQEVPTKIPKKKAHRKLMPPTPLRTIRFEGVDVIQTSLQ